MEMTTWMLPSPISVPFTLNIRCLAVDFIIPPNALRFPVDSDYFGMVSIIPLNQRRLDGGQRWRLDHTHKVKIFFFFKLMVGTMTTFPPIFLIGCEHCGLLSYRGGDRKQSACYLLQSHWQPEPFLPPSSCLVSSSDSWTFPAIVACVCRVDTVEMCLGQTDE